MKREKNVDYFDDILSETGGIHDGRAMDAFEGMSETITPEGLKVKMSCTFCGREHLVTLEWEELYVIGSNMNRPRPILPQKWAYSPNNQSAYVQFRCSTCNNDGIAVHETPAEAQTACHQGRQRGYINDQQIAVWQQKLRQSGA